MWFSVQRILAMQAATAALISLVMALFAVLSGAGGGFAVVLALVIVEVVVARLWLLVRLSREMTLARRGLGPKQREKRLGPPGRFFSWLPVIEVSAMFMYCITVFQGLGPRTGVPWIGLMMLAAGLLLLRRARRAEAERFRLLAVLAYVAVLVGSLVFPLSVFRSIMEMSRVLGYQVGSGGWVLLAFGMVMVASTAFALWDVSRRRMTWLRVRGLNRIAGADDEYRRILREGER